MLDRTWLAVKYSTKHLANCELLLPNTVIRALPRTALHTMADKSNGDKTGQCGDKISSSGYCKDHGYQEPIKKDQKK